MPWLPELVNTSGKRFLSVSLNSGSHCRDITVTLLTCSHATLTCLLVLSPGSPGRTSCPDTGGPTRGSSRTSVKCVRRSLPAATTCPNTSKSTGSHASVAPFAPSTNRGRLGPASSPTAPSSGRRKDRSQDGPRPSASRLRLQLRCVGTMETVLPEFLMPKCCFSWIVEDVKLFLNPVS